MNPTTQIDIKILTFNRWLSLQRLLDSLEQQNRVTEKGNLFQFNLEVIDNSPRHQLRPEQVETLRGKYNAKYFYLGAGNIAAGRNAALERCGSPFLAFIDDDEVANKSWLPSLLSVMETYRADVVFGPSLPLYLGNPNHWIARSKILEPKDSHEGSDTGFVESTANCLIRMAPIRESRLRFNLAFGKCGGSDAEFFTVLRCLSLRFAFAPKAWVQEEFNNRRLKTWWLLKRALRCGGCRGAVLSRLKREQYAQEVVGATLQIRKALFSRNDYFPERIWNLFHSLGLILFSVSGSVLSEYEARPFHFTRFNHKRWSLTSILSARFLSSETNVVHSR